MTKRQHVRPLRFGRSGFVFHSSFWFRHSGFFRQPLTPALLQKREGVKPRAQASPAAGYHLFWPRDAMPDPVRPPSLIALRACREALHVARDVAYPELKIEQPPLIRTEVPPRKQYPSYFADPGWVQDTPCGPELD